MAVGMRKTLEWELADAELSAAIARRCEADYELGILLLRARRLAVHAHRGFASFAEYAERVTGWEPKHTAERLRVAEALEDLPKIAAGLLAGRLTWSHCRELTRKVVADFEEAWLERVAGKTVRQIEEILSVHSPGAHPDDPPCPLDRKMRLGVDLSMEAMALYREAVMRVRRDAGGDLTEEDAIIAMARAVLGQGRDAGRASYQIALTVCPKCNQGLQDAAGRVVPVGSEVVERAECDAQWLEGAERAVQDVAPAVRRQVIRRDHGRCRVPGCRNAAWVDIHHVVTRADGGSHEPENLVTLCPGHHRAVHNGHVVVRALAGGAFQFEHADGGAYAFPIEPRIAEMLAEAFLMLKTNGVREGDARTIIERIRPHVGAEHELGDVARMALREVGKR